MRACAVSLDELRNKLNHFLENELDSLVTNQEGVDATPVTGANVLVAIFAERESHAAYFLQEQEMTRYDAVNFIAHGVAKDPSMNEPREVTGSEEFNEHDDGVL